MVNKLELILASAFFAGVVGCSLDKNGIGSGDAGSERIEADGGDDVVSDATDRNDAKCDNLEQDCPNSPPLISIVDEMNNPYTERNVLRGLNTAYLTQTSDPDGDAILCRFEFSDGFARDWGSDCSVVHAISENGNYDLIARAKDSFGFEGESYNVRLNVTDILDGGIDVPDAGMEGGTDGGSDVPVADAGMDTPTPTDAGVDVPIVDAGSDVPVADAGMDVPVIINNPPTIDIVDEMGMPYAERNILTRMPYLYNTNAQDPDPGDSLECRFEIDGVPIRDWNPDCSVVDTRLISGDYTFTARVRDSMLLEGAPDSAIVHARQMNNPPTIDIVDNLGNPYSERDVIIAEPTSYDTNASDPDGDSVECRFEFSDGTIYDWNNLCDITHAIPTTGDHALTARVRDVRMDGMSREGAPDSAILHVLPENTPPTIEIVDDVGMPYAERRVINGELTQYITNASDPDGDSVECRFEFSDGFTRDWNPDCTVSRAIGFDGDYNLTARVRDVRMDGRSREGASDNAILHVAVNNPPTIEIVDDVGMPYAERNVLRADPTIYHANASDPDGDSVECRFEFSDGTIYDWNNLCDITHAIPTTGDHALTARVRDPRVEGVSDGVLLHVADRWFDRNFQYRRRFVAWQGGAGPISNIPILVGSGGGVLTLNTAELIAAGKLNSNCNDLIITSDSGVVLPYEFEDRVDPVYGCNTPTTLLFAKTNLLGGGVETNHYLYYGNPAGGSAEDPANTWRDYSLVYHFKDSGITILDSSPIGNNGNLIIEGIGSPMYANACLGKGLVFNGGNHIIVPDSPSLNFGDGGSFTLHILLRNIRAVEDSNIIHKVSNDAARVGYEVDVTANRAVLRVREGAVVAIAQSSNITDDACHYVTFVRDRSTGTVRAYTDGVRTGSAMDSTSDITNAADLVIAYDPRSRWHYQGTLSEVYITRRALLEDEIRRMSADQGLCRIESEER